MNKSKIRPKQTPHFCFRPSRWLQQASSFQVTGCLNRSKAASTLKWIECGCKCFKSPACSFGTQIPNTDSGDCVPSTQFQRHRVRRVLTSQRPPCTQRSNELCDSVQWVFSVSKPLIGCQCLVERLIFTRPSQQAAWHCKASGSILNGCYKLSPLRSGTFSANSPTICCCYKAHNGAVPLGQRLHVVSDHSKQLQVEAIVAA